MNDRLIETQQEWRKLLGASLEQQAAAGYAQTIREILQQPATWRDTANVIAWSAAMFADSVAGIGSILLTGSGSSQFAAECLAPVLQADLGIPVAAVSSGAILANPDQALPRSGPSLMVSFARSGDNPESYAAVDLALSMRPRLRHLVITCNREGRLASEFRLDDRVRAMTLDHRTNDQAAAMTSSATNMILAGRFLGMAESPDAYRNAAATVARATEELFETQTDAIAGVARSGFDRAVFLGSGPLYGAAREAALKMLQMTGGRIPVLAETYMGLRHGPMTFIRDGALVVCFQSSSNPARSYEADVMRELKTGNKLTFGDSIPKDVGDSFAVLAHIAAGQLLALFRGLAEGLRPDTPEGIRRVVPSFEIHRKG